ncbi:MAG: universal stress protein [Candidatus Odinarchaeota archaeon]
MNKERWIKIYKKILIGTDGSLHANNAAVRAAELQKEWKSKIVIFHSINHHKLPLNITPERKYPQEIIQNIEELNREAGRELLKTTQKMFDNSISSVETRLIEDLSPDEYISDVVEKENFDLVVIGSRGHHSKIKEIFLGTVATHVSKNALCDVLIVR